MNNDVVLVVVHEVKHRVRRAIAHIDVRIRPHSQSLGSIPGPGARGEEPHPNSYDDVLSLMGNIRLDRKHAAWSAAGLALAM